MEYANLIEFASLAAPEVVETTTSAADSDTKFREQNDISV